MKIVRIVKNAIRTKTKKHRIVRIIRGMFQHVTTYNSIQQYIEVFNIK